MNPEEADRSPAQCCPYLNPGSAVASAKAETNRPTEAMAFALRLPSPGPGKPYGFTGVKLPTIRQSECGIAKVPTGTEIGSTGVTARVAANARWPGPSHVAWQDSSKRGAPPIT
jgi:hypothetical protein